MTKHWTALVTTSLAMLLALFAPAPFARANIFQWEYVNPASPSQGKQPSATLAPDGAGVNAAPGANLSNRNLNKAYLIDADLSQLVVADEEGQVLYYIEVNLTGANLSQADLSNARLYGANLAGANLTDAEIRGARFYGVAITTAQLYSTASHQAHELTGVYFSFINLTDADFAGQNLASAGFPGATLVNANFNQANLKNADFSSSLHESSDLTGANLSQSNLTNTDFSGIAYFGDAGDVTIISGSNLTGANLGRADARGANFQYATLSGANTANLIKSNGHIAGLDLTAGASLVVRDYDGNAAVAKIVVDQHLAMDASGALRLVFDADAWDSTISFAPSIPVSLGGTLELTFAPGVNVAAQIGRTIDLFDWTGVTPTGTFTVYSPYAWNLANLYTTGEVTLTDVGEILLGDFNGDSVVDADDLASWKAGYGTSGNATLTQGDADGDQDVDGADFLTWQRQLGQTSAVSVNTSVPEPTALALAAIGLCGAACVRLVQVRRIRLHPQSCNRRHRPDCSRSGFSGSATGSRSDSAPDCTPAA